MNDTKIMGALQDVEEVRGRNLRQLLLRASRIVNRHVIEGLKAKGYANLRSTHTTLLSNIDLAGSTVTVAAERAGITKQAMGRLATELKTAGYVTIGIDANDKRARILELTDSGHQLMLDSFDVMANLQRRYARTIGEDRFASALQTLAIFIDKAEQR